jgi:hypothetical protein
MEQRRILSGDTVPLKRNNGDDFIAIILTLAGAGGGLNFAARDVLSCLSATSFVAAIGAPFRKPTRAAAVGVLLSPWSSSSATGS